MNDFFSKLKDRFRRIIDFIKDTRKELNNVSWPSWREVRGTTIVVIAAVFFFGLYLFVVDIIVGNGVDYLLKARN
jgi:preprotein translocase subunit SecE